MGSISKSDFGSLPDGQKATLYTLRNTKGASVKVTDFGARIVGWRAMGKDYAYVNLLPEGPDVAYYSQFCPVSGAARLSEHKLETTLWKAQEEYDGIVFSTAIDGTDLSVQYSFSNDNEILIRYKMTSVTPMVPVVTKIPLKVDATLENMSVLIQADEVIADGSETVSSVAHTNLDLRGFTRADSLAYLTGDELWSVRDVPPEIEMEPGMFGYDPTCPIDYLDSGLKKAAIIQGKNTKVTINIFTNMPSLSLRPCDKAQALALECCDPKPVTPRTPWLAQTVLSVKVG